MLFISMKNYILFITIKNKKAQTLLYFDKASDAYEVMKEVTLINNEEYLFTLATIYSKLIKTKRL